MGGRLKGLFGSRPWENALKRAAGLTLHSHSERGSDVWRRRRYAAIAVMNGLTPNMLIIRFIL